MKHYNYIFAGAGLSALMTVYKMILSGKFLNQSILLIDNDLKNTNDRTWCFWVKPNHNLNKWEQIISKKWDTALFANQYFAKNLNLHPYQYKMIKGLDFYNLVLNTIEKAPNVTFINAKVLNFTDNNTQVIVNTTNQNYTCNKLINSIYNTDEVAQQTKYPVLQQHFIGWFIKTEQEVFNPTQATFMDFSVAQNGNTKFMYVLPFSKTEALLEPTLFSHQHLKKEAYEHEIKIYLEKLDVKNYVITEKEQGSIPMTCYPFWKKNTKNILHIGSAGGWTKASTGFTFKRTDKKSTALIQFLQHQNNFKKFNKTTRYWLYDLLFIAVLDKQNELGASVFSALFKKGNPELIFKFLDEETTLIEDLKVMLKCPTIPFLIALFREIYNHCFKK